MTIASTETKVIYGGNGSTATFAVPFMFLRNDDIEVVLVDAEGGEYPQSEGTDYELSGAGVQTGGTCAMAAVPEAGQTLVIRREPSMVQEVDYVENDAFPAATHEAALDKLTMICQALAEKLDRAVTFGISSAVTGVNMPEPRAGRLIGWDDAAGGLGNYAVSELGALVTPVAVHLGGTGADNPTEALFNFGFGGAGLTVAGCDEPAEVLEAMGAEPADRDILKADTPDMLQAAFGEEAQVHSGTSTAQASLSVTRNHILWPLTAESTLLVPSFPYDGTYVFHVYPHGNTLNLGAGYKYPSILPAPDSSAGEIRIVVEVFNNRKTVVSLVNMEA
ncbi:phage tail fiber protein [Pseudodesulfovibrio indicus]|uniref:phage tail fiber protein n=1 Tax=Pseudodesulfovibrio indicus TaxID=1716143 RepID=UPI002931395C|nr:phage tail fiber protein [Pseudodesulfovibrio indicus]